MAKTMYTSNLVNIMEAPQKKTSQPMSDSWHIKSCRGLLTALREIRDFNAERITQAEPDSAMEKSLRTQEPQGSYRGESCSVRKSQRTATSPPEVFRKKLPIVRKRTIPTG